MRIELNDWGYWEIDYYDDANSIEYLSKLLGVFDWEVGCYYKIGEKWNRRSSGMSFNLTKLDCYSKLKYHLDNELNIFLRKEKLLKLSKI